MDSNIAIKGAEGVLIGAGLDQLFYGLSAYIPQLTQSTGIKVPGYASGGIHYDDALGLVVAGGVAAMGAVKKNPGLILMGVGMAAGAFISSQFQVCMPKQIGATSARVQTGSLVQVD